MICFFQTPNGHSSVILSLSLEFFQHYADSSKHFVALEAQEPLL